MDDYFQKEATQLKFQYSRLLVKAVHESNMVSKVAVTETTVLSSLPVLKAEKMKTIENLFKSVGHKQFIELSFSHSIDVILRMQRIAKHDRKFPLHVRNIYLLHISFVYDSVLIPTFNALTVMLLRLSASSITTTTTSLPPFEFLSILSCCFYAINQTSIHFNQNFAPHFTNSQHFLLSCEEANHAAIQKLTVS